ncbi:hypothetical protein D3C80_1586770 [compost metagenome]
MRDVEQAGLFTGVQVFLHHAQGVLHRHVVAGERDHARAQFQVQGVEWGLQQLFGGHLSLLVIDVGLGIYPSPQPSPQGGEGADVCEFQQLLETPEISPLSPRGRGLG